MGLIGFQYVKVIIINCLNHSIIHSLFIIYYYSLIFLNNKKEQRIEAVKVGIASEYKKLKLLEGLEI